MSDLIEKDKRGQYFGWRNRMLGFVKVGAMFIGGFCLPLLPALFGYKILTLFAISSLLRITIGTLLLRRLKEVRPVERIKSDQLFFSIIGIRPILGVERKTIRY